MNVFKEAAPWARIITLIVSGIAIIYGIGRWDQRISMQDAQLVSQTRAILSTARAARAWRDSLSRVEELVRERDTELAATAARHRSDLARLTQVDQVEVATLARTSLDSILPSLRMRPIHLPDSVGPLRGIVFATDSTGVRFLAGRLLRVEQLERQLPVRDSLARADSTRIVNLAAGLNAASLRADSAEARVTDLEPLLEQFLKRSQCRIL